MRLPPFLSVVSLGELLYRDWRLRIEKGIGQISPHVIAEPMAPHVNHVGPGLLDDAGYALGLLVGKACAVCDAGDLADLDGVNENGDRKVLAETPFDFPDNLGEEAGPLFRGASVSVLTPVPEGRKEIVQQVAAAGVDVYPFESRLLGPDRCARELVDDLLDLRVS